MQKVLQSTNAILLAYLIATFGYIFLASQTIHSVRAGDGPKSKIAITAIRLDNGNTLIGCTLGNLVIEVDKGGTTVWQVTICMVVRSMTVWPKKSADR
jgi:hypothetical protein